ncbi:MAG: hypothetical protein UX08_C0004G0020 [Candidatus Collierbacteria bacterium GW2011_GWB1_45_35]|uniref:HTH merR-type domain-containing protein n=1 Tax=Candidatus Collierbacteria bacterium GW2011_GWB2_45_17 TaxID=1618388 RepID=A0A837IEU4_9BACT|nr:MAG: hypothetical protein UW48_C0002G0080 [Microgenomates group bacterium GW2011_GWC1_44_23]KKT95644.1 MAG: hypothetical protein UW96_C0006G0075 [Candidatus Collierbacteria bacterium GW2011_GWA1_45_15]KKU00456.1 MAG: hypothetical protein UX01_C0004G0023 [Candidatus Collierbacteria bacterium GW2011_GWB2_45_17]KKU05557.1 MAG: hypothetical protein UX08_C0004G0020 [Candidatus Collierbacteria bacterium GW2011_GWB1_45_35]KKU08167.1 MAG: hypothetical protein UX11_C0006G0023 [Candidatus Collierbacte
MANICEDLHRYGRIYIDMTNSLISISNIAKQLGVSIDTLRRWDKTHRLPSTRIGPRGHRYYRQADIDLFLRNDIYLARQWAMSTVGSTPPSEVYCQTRDVFQVRLERLQGQLQRVVPESTMSLLCAIAGEIGNNSFDHNLGNWPDVTGIYFSFDLRNGYIVLADRGLGILTTLKRALPELKDTDEALKIAFTETISGRRPEVRGNGLKFVRQVVIDNPFTLMFQTGDVYLNLKQNDRDVIISHTDGNIRGCLAIINF